MRTAIAIIALIASLAAAQAFGMGKMGFIFGREGSVGGKRTVVIPPSTGPALLVNGTSTALLIDNVNSACLAGGSC